MNNMQNDSEKMHFEKVTKCYRQTIAQWFTEDHVKAFYYGDGLQNTLNNLELYYQGINNNGRYTFDHWLAFYEEIPFGFLMTTPITGPYDTNDNYNKWYVTGKSTFSLDLLIGDTAFLGKGLAHKMIRAFILTQFSNTDYFIIDPEKNNTKAIHIYEKVGFSKVDEFCPAYNPVPHVMLRLAVHDLKHQKKIEV